MFDKSILKKVRQIEVRTKGLVSNLFGGEYHSAFKGRGMEFVEVRPYQFGDDIRTIDWNVSARSGDETYVKVFQEEREQTLMLMVDISGSGDFGSQVEGVHHKGLAPHQDDKLPFWKKLLPKRPQAVAPTDAAIPLETPKGKTKRELAAEICAVLAFSAIQNNDKVGLVLFSDQVELFVPPKKGRRHVLRIIRDLYAHDAKSPYTKLSTALQHVLQVLRRRAIVLLISDFHDTGFEKPLQALIRRHDTIGIRISDLRENTLPEVGLVPLIDAEHKTIQWVDTSSAQIQRQMRDSARRRERAWKEKVKKLQFDVVEVDTQKGYLDPLVRFFRERHKRR